MKLQNTYLMVLLILPSVVAIESCNKTFIDEGYNDALQCSTSTRVNSTKNHETDFELIDGSNLFENFHLYNKFSLYCCFYSKPYCPNIRWFKNGEELFGNDENHHIKEGGRTLDVFYARRNDEGDYFCNATTPDGRKDSHTIKVTLTYPCSSSDKAYLEANPGGHTTIKVRRGSSQNLTCSFFCAGDQYFPEYVWRNGQGKLISNNSKYKISSESPLGENAPKMKHTLTIISFTKSENLTCVLRQSTGLLVSHTFHVVPKECEGDPFIKSANHRYQEIEKGSNKTLKCQIFCFKKENELVWKNGNGDNITQNSSKYKLTRMEVERTDATQSYYEISLTITNITKSENFSCHVWSVANMSNRTFQLSLESDHPTSKVEKIFLKPTELLIVIGVILVAFVFVVILTLGFRKRIKRLPIFYHPETKRDTAIKYDAFVSFSEADGGSFVRSSLVPMLEGECGYTLSLHYREFIPGLSIVDNITEFIYDSRKVLMVVTPKFIKSEWCMFEVEQGIRRMVEQPKALVVIMLNEIPVTQLPSSLQTLLRKVTYLKWDASKLDKMREKLTCALSRPLTNQSQADQV